MLVLKIFQKKSIIPYSSLSLDKERAGVRNKKNNSMLLPPLG